MLGFVVRIDRSIEELSGVVENEGKVNDSGEERKLGRVGQFCYGHSWEDIPRFWLEREIECGGRAAREVQ